MQLHHIREQVQNSITVIVQMEQIVEYQKHIRKS